MSPVPAVIVTIRTDLTALNQAARDALPAVRCVAASVGAFRAAFHPLAHPDPMARCRTCNPRGNPPAAPHARGYHAKTRRRNRR